MAAVAAANHGYITNEVAAHHGISARVIERLVSNGVLVRHGPGIQRFAGSPPTWESDCRRALLVAGAGAAIPGPSAAALLGCDGFDRGPIEILVPRGRRGLGLDQVRVRTSVDIGRGDRIVVAGLTVTSGTRTVIDLSGRVPRVRLEAALDSLLRDGRTSVTSIRRQLDKLMAGRPRLVHLQHALDGRAGTHTELERAFVRLVERAALPVPRAQVRFAGRDRRVIRVDFLWEEIGLVIEVSGHRTHSTREQRRSDAARQRTLVSRGARVVEFTSDEVFHAGPSVIAELRSIRASLSRFPTATVGKRDN